MSNDSYTVAELGTRINEFGEVTDEAERAANVVFIRMLHTNLKEGGTWGWPAAREIYKKKGDGFERLK